MRPAKNLRLLPNRGSIIGTAVVATIAASLLALSEPVTLSIDGQRIVSDVPPVTQQTHAFVPIRAIADGLGADMTYDSKSGQIEIVRGHDVLSLRAGDHVAHLNGNKMTLKVAPFTVRGRTMVGLKTIARAFGSKVRYDGMHAKIDVVTPGVVEAEAQQPQL